MSKTLRDFLGKQDVEIVLLYTVYKPSSIQVWRSFHLDESIAELEASLESGHAVSTGFAAKIQDQYFPFYCSRDQGFAFPGSQEITITDPREITRKVKEKAAEKQRSDEIDF